jgi:hypothetical protein
LLALLSIASATAVAETHHAPGTKGDDRIAVGRGEGYDEVVLGRGDEILVEVRGSEHPAEPESADDDGCEKVRRTGEREACASHGEGCEPGPCASMRDGCDPDPPCAAMHPGCDEPVTDEPGDEEPVEEP